MLFHCFLLFLLLLAYAVSLLSYAVLLLSTAVSLLSYEILEFIKNGRIKKEPYKF